MSTGYKHLRQLIRETLLQEEVFGALAFVYTGSAAPPDVFIPLIVDDTLDPGKGKGAMYGKGLYSVYDLAGTQTEKGFYGNYIYKLAINLHGYLCFDMDVATKVYGKPLTVVEQMELLGIDKGLIKSAREIFDKTRPDGRFERFTAAYANPISHLVRGLVKGLVFTGSHDGKVAVIYDASTVTPVAYRTVRAKLWKRVGKDVKSKSAGRISAPWREERYEENNLEKLKRLRRAVSSFKNQIDDGNAEGYTIEGDLDLTAGNFIMGKSGGTGITELPDGLHVKGTLIVDPETTSLPVGLRVDGNLALSSSKITEIPDGTIVGGSLSVPNTLLRLPDNMEVGGGFLLGFENKNITVWPPGFKVRGGNISIVGSAITSLPDNMRVGGELDMTNSAIRSLPAGLKVMGQLRLKGTGIDTLPADLQVGGNIVMDKVSPHGIPAHLRHKVYMI